MAAPLDFFGAETGDMAEVFQSNGTWVIDSTAGNHNPQGNSSYKGSLTTTQNVLETKNLLAAPTVFVRAWFKFNGTATNNFLASLIMINPTGGTGGVYGAQIRMSYTTGTNATVLRLLYNGGANQVGADFPIDLSVFHCIELKYIGSTTATGTVEMRVDGVVVRTITNVITSSASGNTDDAFLGLDPEGTAPTSPTGFVWVDDVCMRSDQYPGLGFQKAWMPNATTPGDNAWTKSTGNINACWNSTPFNTTTFASDASNAVDSQTGVMNTTSNTDTGATNGNGIIGPIDTINGVKVGWYGKTSSTASDGADSSIFRTGGVDTLTASTVYTTSDVYHETILSTTPTTAQVRSCEAGVKKGTGTKTHTVEDLWLIVDFIPIQIFPREKRPIRQSLQPPRPSRIKRAHRAVTVITAAAVTSPAVRQKRSRRIQALQKPAITHRRQRIAVMPFARVRSYKKPIRPRAAIATPKRHARRAVLMLSFLVRGRSKQRRPQSPVMTARHHARRSAFVALSILSMRRASRRLKRTVVTTARGAPRKVLHLAQVAAQAALDAIVIWRNRGGY